MPVVINSGSGNQGLTVSIPVIVYAEEKKCSDEELYRALVVSNLISLHQRDISEIFPHIAELQAQDVRPHVE